jgi:FkbM family methyltransferase
MNATLKTLVTSTLKRFDIGIANYHRLQELEHDTRSRQMISLLSRLPVRQGTQLLKALPLSHAQLGQDLFVLSALDFKSNGYFVEFGAADGIYLSNSWLLEKKFGWQGIVAEPARCWHRDLERNRNCKVDTDCVWSESHSLLPFNEVEGGLFSTIDSFRFSDSRRATRNGPRAYNVKTISLGDLLARHGAPKVIDYLPIDTEGSEFDILSHFDFDEYQFRVITCEHNFTPAREKLFALLTKYGYVRTLQDVSEIDDWYVKA